MPNNVKSHSPTVPPESQELLIPGVPERTTSENVRGGYQVQLSLSVARRTVSADTAGATKKDTRMRDARCQG